MTTTVTVQVPSPRAEVLPQASPKLELMTREGRGLAGDWVLCTSMLCCGLTQLIGWSEGLGIDEGNSTLWDERWFTLLYKSAHPQIYIRIDRADYWGSRPIDGEIEAQVHIQRRRNQYMYPTYSYIVSSLVPWIERLEKFIKDHDLGVFTKTGDVRNVNYRGRQVQVGLWTWNGKYPKGGKFDDWARELASQPVKKLSTVRY